MFKKTIKQILVKILVNYLGHTCNNKKLICLSFMLYDPVYDLKKWFLPETLSLLLNPKMLFLPLVFNQSDVEHLLGVLAPTFQSNKIT